MADEKNVFVKTACLNQLVRPKVKIPKWMRREGCGDCTICETHIDNLNCKCRIPVGFVVILSGYWKEEEL